MKAFLLVFSVSSALYAISLDWAAWGRNQLHLVGFARAVVPVSILAFLLLGRGNSGQALGGWLQATFRLPCSGSGLLALVEEA